MVESPGRDLESQSESGPADLDSAVTEEVADLRRQLSRFRRERTLLKNRLRMMEDDLGIEKTKATKSFDDLLYFFPDANIRRLEEIEAFHVKLTSVLKEEHREASVAIKNEVSELDDLIEALEERLRLTETVPTVSTSVLLRYANLSNEIQLLKSANQGYDDKRGPLRRCEEGEDGTRFVPS